MKPQNGHLIIAAFSRSPWQVSQKGTHLPQVILESKMKLYLYCFSITLYDDCQEASPGFSELLGVSPMRTRGVEIDETATSHPGVQETASPAQAAAEHQSQD